MGVAAAPPARLMLYDCFTFFDELDILEIRLNVLRSVADRFVLVEARQTHQGRPKPLHFADNAARFSTFRESIIHVVVDEFPASASTPWTRENYQRDRIADGLNDATPGDLVLISDVDELPQPDVIAARKESPQVTIFRQLLCYYFLNCVAVNHNGTAAPAWSGTVMFPYHPRIDRPQRYRELIGLPGWPGDSLSHRLRAVVRAVRRRRALEGAVRFADHAGWHFSYLGGGQRIIRKLEAFAHTEYNDARYKDPEHIATAIRRGDDLFGRSLRFDIVPLDDRFPDWLSLNADKYQHLIAPVKDSER
jgi:Glycosyltransferase family 17